MSHKCLKCVPATSMHACKRLQKVLDSFAVRFLAPWWSTAFPSFWYAYSMTPKAQTWQSGVLCNEWRWCQLMHSQSYVMRTVYARVTLEIILLRNLLRYLPVLKISLKQRRSHSELSVCYIVRNIKHHFSHKHDRQLLLTWWKQNWLRFSSL